ncbi:MAG: hypothetical protein IJO63_01490 [Bacilli bacterium]|nr:hypothetical protein [Bacilli bacterium]
MNKKYIKFILISFSFLLIYLAFINANLVGSSIQQSLKLFTSKVFPFLFIMMVINNFLIGMNLPYYIYKIFPNIYIYIFIFSALSGSPINAIIINKLLEEAELNETQASYALCFSTLNNPLFLYNYFNILFNNNNLIIKLFIIIYVSNILILLYTIIRHPINKSLILQNKECSPAKELVAAIKNSTLNLITIFTTIAFFKLITDLLLPSNNILSVIIKGLTEITQGLNSICILNVSIKTKELLTLVILSFAGFSIHIQISSILEKYNINYKYFYLSRLFLMIISIIIICLS